MYKILLKEGKNAVYLQDHAKLKHVYSRTNTQDYQLPISDIYLKLFYYACKHNRKETIKFLFQIYFEIFSDYEKIAIRQGFYYAKTKIKEKDLREWYSSYVLPIIKLS